MTCKVAPKEVLITKSAEVTWTGKLMVQDDVVVDGHGVWTALFFVHVFCCWGEVDSRKLNMNTLN